MVPSAPPSLRPVEEEPGLKGGQQCFLWVGGTEPLCLLPQCGGRPVCVQARPRLAQEVAGSGCNACRACQATQTGRHVAHASWAVLDGSTQAWLPLAPLCRPPHKHAAWWDWEGVSFHCNKALRPAVVRSAVKLAVCWHWELAHSFAEHTLRPWGRV